ncbi:amino acid permease [Ferviditalea candida]|uniref:Amino acid permease n=1 Tax=Ferviditalea candida TaxID=3108399 RepID=A0ABU5ZMK5_9BACL|nr:amino acid permease [Paenibacillaceae bacterium T2]
MRAYSFLQTGVKWASAFISVGALAGLTSVLLVSLYGQSRSFFAMSRDGLLPKRYCAIHPRFGTPHKITAVVGGFVSLLSAFVPIGIIAEMANIGTLSAFVLSAAGVIILRITHPELHRPFKIPWGPVFPVLSILFSIYLMLILSEMTWIRFAVWMGAGLLIYGGYGFRHSRLGGEGSYPMSSDRFKFAYVCNKVWLWTKGMYLKPRK